MTKRFLGVFAVLALLASVFLMSATTFAEESDYTPDDQEQIPVNPQPEYEEDFHLSDEQIGLISQNCPSIKTQLRRVQRADAKSRVHLGAQFEVISTNLMLNLNLRLVKNSLATAELADQQTKFSNERDVFKNDYISYSQSLDDLIKADCQKNPEGFYDQLTSVREKRAKVQSDVYRLNSMIKQHRDAVVELKESL